MNIKQPTTFAEQVELLKSRGIIITNNAIAENFLHHVNYYTLSGYLHAFKDGEIFQPNITIEKIIAIYQCDKRFKNIILYALDEIEQNIKTKIAYILAHSIGALGYLDSKNFSDIEQFENFREKFIFAVNRNSSVPFVKHHIQKYDSNLPIWVAINLFTLGMTEHFYENLQPCYKKSIAKEFDLSVAIFYNWLHCISYLRNMVAHYMRLYNFRIRNIPKKDKKDVEFPHPTHFVFDIIFIMKYLYPVAEEWQNFIVSTIKQIFEQYKDDIRIKSYGFPNNWEQLLHLYPHRDTTTP